MVSDIHGSSVTDVHCEAVWHQSIIAVYAYFKTFNSTNKLTKQGNSLRSTNLLFFVRIILTVHLE